MYVGTLFFWIGGAIWLVLAILAKQIPGYLAGAAFCAWGALLTTLHRSRREKGRVPDVRD